MADLTPAQSARFVRQIMLDAVGARGQRALLSGAARVAGHEVAELYAGRAGVGSLVPGLVDEASLAPESIVAEPAARSVLAGARAALAELRRILEASAR